MLQIILNNSFYTSKNSEKNAAQYSCILHISANQHIRMLQYLMYQNYTKTGCNGCFKLYFKLYINKKKGNKINKT